MKRKKNPYSLLAQIQRVIALEAMSPYVLEIYLDRDTNPPKLYAYTTKIHNPNCLYLPEKTDIYLAAPNDVVRENTPSILNDLANHFIDAQENLFYTNN